MAEVSEPARRGRRPALPAVLLIVVGVLITAGVLAVVQRGGGERAGPVRDFSFDGDFGRGLSAWRTQIHPDRIAIVDDPILGARRKVARFTVLDTDVGPTPNPRAQLESPATLGAGREFWIGWSTLFPSDFPALPDDGWLTFEAIYGPPFDDAGPLAMRVVGGQVRFQRNRTYGFDVPWQRTLVRGRWLDFAEHIKLSKDPSQGYVELYLNTGGGWRRQLLAGRRRLSMQTLDASNGDGPNSFRLANYRKRGMFGSVTLFQASARVGASLSAVAPSSYGG